MKKTLQIQNGLVFICGPSTSGKTTLAKRIFEQAPYRDKIWISHDQVLIDFIRAHGYPNEAFFGGISEEDDEKFRMGVVKALHDAFFQRKFVVFDGLYCDAKRLGELLLHMPCFGLDRPITLLKMFLPQELQLQFINKRLSDFDREKLMQQRSEAEKFVAPGHYSQEIEWVKEYTIDDPREIELEFRKSGELSKELLAAFEVHEIIQEKCGVELEAEFLKAAQLLG